MQKESMYKRGERDIMELDFGQTADILREEYI